MKKSICMILCSVLFLMLCACTGNEEKVSSYEVVEPKIDKTQTIGTEVSIDYEDKDLLVFHGYFGLFVYDLKEQKMLEMLDLKSIGCNEMQGDSMCQVFVSKDGTQIYLCPLENNEHKEMYVYKWKEASLDKTEYDLKDKDLFERDSEAVGGNLEEGSSGTIGELQYVTGEKKIQLFADVN